MPPSLPLPMYNDQAAAGQWHALFAPGGCEYYQVDLLDDRGTVRCGVRIGVGDPTSGRYARQLRRYRRWPTRCRPPLPADFAFSGILIAHGKSSWLASNPGPLGIEADGLRLRHASVQLLRSTRHAHAQGQVGDASVVIELVLSSSPPRQRRPGVVEFIVQSASGHYSGRGISGELTGVTGRLLHVLQAEPFSPADL